MQLIQIDVRELAPPEPMTAILHALASLSANQCLLVHHSREPFPLYEKLLASDWRYHCETNSKGEIQLTIFRPHLQEAFDHLRQQGLSE